MWGERTRTIALWLLALLIATSMGVLLAANPAHAATFVVNRTADTPDANLANAACDANASQAGNQCTLRAAIQESNDTNGVDQIRFNIVSAASVKTISPASALPTITEALTINGYSQTGASANTLAEGNDAVLKIQLNGTNAGSANGLVIQASDSTVKGLVINRFEGNGVLISGSGATGTKVQGNFIGTGANGTTALGNDDGVAISSASDSTIGSAIGSTAGGNRIANNDQDGVLVFGGAAVGNRVLSNSIFSNGETGIDLGGGTEDSFEVTANDTDDPDAPTSKQPPTELPCNYLGHQERHNQLHDHHRHAQQQPQPDLHRPVLRGGAGPLRPRRGSDPGGTDDRPDRCRWGRQLHLCQPRSASRATGERYGDQHEWDGERHIDRRHLGVLPERRRHPRPLKTESRYRRHAGGWCWRGLFRNL